jgi:hypothetical protein
MKALIRLDCYFFESRDNLRHSSATNLDSPHAFPVCVLLGLTYDDSLLLTRNAQGNRAYAEINEG